MNWKRGANITFNKYFSSKEFECQCGVCEDQIIDDNLLLRLTGLREEYALPINVNSGYRCADHQASLLSGGTVQTVKNSTHCLGQAADIRGPLMDTLCSLAEKYFDAIGDGRKLGFLHCDIRGPQKRRWSY